MKFDGIFYSGIMASYRCRDIRGMSTSAAHSLALKSPKKYICSDCRLVLRRSYKLSLTSGAD